MKQMKKMLEGYRDEVVKELGEKYGFEVEEAMKYLKGKEETADEEKRGRPAKKTKKVVSKEQMVDAVVMEGLAEPHDNLKKDLSDGSVGQKGEKEEEKSEEEVVKKKVKRVVSEDKEKTKADKEKAKAEKEKAKAEKEKAKAEKEKTKAEKEKTKGEKKPRAPKKKTADAADAAEVVVVAGAAGAAGAAVKNKKTEVGGFPLKIQEGKKQEADANEVKENPIAEDDEEEEDEHEEFEFQGTKYYRTPDNVVFDTETLEQIGTWNEEEKRIEPVEEDEE